jgi:hypothetical protein
MLLDVQPARSAVAARRLARTRDALCIVPLSLEKTLVPPSALD